MLAVAGVAAAVVVAALTAMSGDRGCGAFVLRMVSETAAVAAVATMVVVARVALMAMLGAVALAVVALMMIMCQKLLV